MSKKPIFLAILVFGAIIGVAFSSYVYLTGVSETQVRTTLLEQYRQSQIDNTESLSKHVSSDISNIITRLELLASHPGLQGEDLTSRETTGLLEEADAEIRGITLINSIALLDENNIHVNNSAEELRKFIGLDRSDTEYVIETRKSPRPYVSSGFTGASGTYGISVSVPIVNTDTGKYIGMIVVGLPTIQFFERYGNVLDLDSSSIVALDRKTIVISTFVDGIIGEHFYGQKVQEAIGYNDARNAVFGNAMSGKADSVIFAASLGERLVSGYPVYVNGEQVMSVFITTPTSAIYSKVDLALQAQAAQTAILLSSIVGVIAVFVAFLLKWNSSLEKIVTVRTAELEKSIDQLKAHDKMQQEFINIAAHELRTPVQPMLGITELMESSFNGNDKIAVSREEVNMLARNAKRLERLSSGLLEVARIESGSIHLDLEPIDISEEICNVIANAKTMMQDRNDVNIIYQEPKSKIIVQGDRIRLFQVLSNLFGNAIKFARKGMVTINVEKNADGKEAIIRVRDTGSGIDPEIMPKLFSKFATKSESGTGIGLFIVKNIVEAHGGKIWAENNKDGPGATFTFTLPVV